MTKTLTKLKKWITTENLKGAKVKNIHPGNSLQEKFLIPIEISAYKLLLAVGISQACVCAITKGNRRIISDTAPGISIYFGSAAKIWPGPQAALTLKRKETAGKLE